jgi:hypothetical protein
VRQALVGLGRQDGRDLLGGDPLQRAVEGAGEVVAEVGDGAADRVGDAGAGGDDDRGMPSSRARAEAWSGPAPPKANRA